MKDNYWKIKFEPKIDTSICIPESFNMNISHQFFLLHNNLYEFTALEHKFKR